MYCISCVSVCVKYKDRRSEGSPFRDMLSLVAGRGGLACLGKDSLEGAAVEHSNFIIPHDYFVCAGDSKSHLLFPSLQYVVVLCSSIFSAFSFLLGFCVFVLGTIIQCSVIPVIVQSSRFTCGIVVSLGERPLLVLSIRCAC